jgi:hypothetical protein
MNKVRANLVSHVKGELKKLVKIIRKQKMSCFKNKNIFSFTKQKTARLKDKNQKMGQEPKNLHTGGCVSFRLLLAIVAHRRLQLPMDATAKYGALTELTFISAAYEDEHDDGVQTASGLFDVGVGY